MRSDRKRTVTPLHVKPSELALALVAWSILVVLMTSLVLWLTNGLATYANSSPVEIGQVPHFVCTVDAGGTLLRCQFSATAKPPL